MTITIDTAVINELPFIGNYSEDMITATDFIKTYLFTPDPTDWLCTRSQAEMVINGDLRKHFNFKSAECKTLIRYFTENAPQPRKPQTRKQSAKGYKGKPADLINALLNGDGIDDVVQEPKDVDEKDVREEAQSRAKERAIEILKNGNPIEQICKTIQKSHIGDEIMEEAICISIAGQSCLNTNGIQIGTNGEPGSGKSHAIIMHLHLIRARHKIESTLSAKALLYAKHIKPGTIVFSDDVTPDEALEETIKRSTTNYQRKTEHRSVRDQESVVCTIPERINWYLTSVDSESSTQLLSRQFKCNTSDSKTQKDAITEKQINDAVTGDYGLTDITEDVLICRYIYDEIKSLTFKVVIPYARRIEIFDNRDARNTNMFFDMIKGYAIMNFMQRERDEDGNVIANEEDFHNANRLYSYQLEASVSKFTSKESTVLRYISRHTDCTIKDIVNGTMIPDKTVRNLIHGRQNGVSGGLLEKVKELTVTSETHTERINDEKSISRTATHYTLTNFEDWSIFENKFAELHEVDVH